MAIPARLAHGGMQAWLHRAAGQWSAAVGRRRLGFWVGLAGCAVAGWPPVPAAEQGYGSRDEQRADEEGVHEDADRDRCEDAGGHGAAGCLPTARAKTPKVP